MHVYKNATADDLRRQVRSYISNPKDLNQIEKALAFAREKHEGQFRKSGEPYLVHLLTVATILATMHVSPTTIIAGLLHDVVEDTEVTTEDVAAKFGKSVANLVESVTKIGNIQFKNEKEYLAENHRKILIAMAKDIRVIYIKLVDRLHNMRTLLYQSPAKQRKIANETLSVYAPIAHRLGISEIKNELEDLCLQYLYRKDYYEIARRVELKKAERDEQIQKMIDEISGLLISHRINHRIFGRSKHFYSIYKKMTTKNKRFDEILDLMAIRIITEDEVNCYESLGYIHACYRPIPGRLKDYIAMPKMNMYQSLHTTIVGEDGFIFEVQIRTEEMDDIAERGVAAHWRYKEGLTAKAKDHQKEIEEKLAWFRDINLISDEDVNATEYMESLQKDVFEANVYVMTPNGRVIDLPNGATPVDFAYHIHSEVGEACVGATVNGSLVPLNTVLKTGDVVQIKTSKNSSGPSEDWLKFVKTNRAKNRIKNFFQKKEMENKEALVTRGELLFKQEIAKRKLDEKEIFTKARLEPIYGSFNYRSYEDFMYAVALKSMSLQKVFERIESKPKAYNNQSLLYNHGPKKAISKSGIRVEGIDSMMISIAQCCSPVMGDEIVGYVSKGKGVKVHRKDCKNIINEKRRLISVEWDENAEETSYETTLLIDSYDRQFLLTDVVTVISQAKLPMNHIDAKLDDTKIFCRITVRVEVKNNEELRSLMANLRKVDSVVKVDRLLN